MPEKQQTDFDFDNPVGQQRRNGTRGQRRQNIERLELPSQDNVSPKQRVSPSTCKSILLLLDDHQRDKEVCWLKCRTVSEKLGYRSEATARRGLKHLEQLGLITVQRTRGASIYSINHHAIAEFTSAADANESALTPPDEGAESGRTYRSRAVDEAVESGRIYRSRAVDSTGQSGRFYRSIRNSILNSSSSVVVKEGDDEVGEEIPRGVTADPWDVAYRRVAQAGVRRWREVVTAAKEAGVSPDHVVRIVEYAEQSAGAISDVSLKCRIEAASPFTEPEDPRTWWRWEEPTVEDRRAAVWLDEALRREQLLAAAESMEADAFEAKVIAFGVEVEQLSERSLQRAFFERRAKQWRESPS